MTALGHHLPAPRILSCDYADWTTYSHGNPLGERRIYNGHLMYVHGHEGHDRCSYSVYVPNSAFTVLESGICSTREVAKGCAEMCAYAQVVCE